jgi:hypoxanthine phosphoribosyltransferase
MSQNHNQKIKMHKDVMLLPVDQVKRNNWNPNFLSTAMQRAIRDDISRNGFIGPIVVQKHNRELDQDYVIINGEHRYDAFLDLNIGNKIPATVLDIDDTTAKVLTLRLNREHGELMPDKVNSLLNRVKDALPEDNQDELFEITGMSEGDIRLISSLDIADAEDVKMVRSFDTNLETPTDPSVNLYLQWSDIEKAAEKCVEQLQSFLPPKKIAIVGIANGGIIPAKLISELIEEKLIAIMPKGPSHTTVNELEVSNLGFASLASIISSVDRIIIVDDIYDKGKTHKQAIENIKKITGEDQIIEYVCLVSKPDPTKKKIIAGIVTHSKQWVVFPWEKLRESG